MPEKFVKVSAAGLTAAALALMVGLGPPSGARADAEFATGRLKTMSDYLAAQKALSFGYDTSLEVVTEDGQKLMLSSSGTITLNRPDKVRATRTGGFADVEILFDGKTATLFGKRANLYSQVDVPGTIDHLIDELRYKYHRPIPAADLLASNFYDQVMPDVVDVKDVGSGFIGGVECDHFAFRTDEVDWQIWIAQGDQPYPCQYVITSKLIANGPQYSIRLRDWKVGDEVAAVSFGFENSTNAAKIDLEDQADFDELPQYFAIGGAQ